MATEPTDWQHKTGPNVTSFLASFKLR